MTVVTHYQELWTSTMSSVVDDDDGAERGDGDEKGRWVLRGPDDDDRDALEGDCNNRKGGKL